MKKNLMVFFLLFILCSCSSTARYKASDDIILYKDNEYFYTDFYVREHGKIWINGELKLIGMYPCDMALFLPKPIYKLSNDVNNDFLFVYGVGEPLYVYSKSSFIEPNYSNFQLTKIECNDFCMEFKDNETILDIFENDNLFAYEELEIEKEYDCIAYSCNYHFFQMSINMIVDVDGNVFASSFEERDLYLLKEEYINF